MKVVQLLIFGFLLLFSAVKAQIMPTQHLFKHGLNEKVQSITEWYNGNDTLTIGNFLIKAEFDTSGFIQTVRSYKDDNLHAVVKYFYQSDSVPDYTVELNPDGSEYLRITFESDENGYAKRAFCNRSEQKKVDDNREPIDLEYYQFYQAQYDQILIKFDNMGRLVSQKFLSLENETLYTYEYMYDFRNNLTEMRFRNASNRLVFKSKFIYAKHNLMKQQKVFRDNTLSEHITYTYDLDTHKNWVRKVAKHVYSDNIYNQNKQNKTETRTRVITYHEE